MIFSGIFFYFSLLSPFSFAAAKKLYKVVAANYSMETPILSKSLGSTFDFNYNAALYSYNDRVGVVVRSQNLKNSSVPFDVGPSYLTASSISFNASGYPSAIPAIDILLPPNNSSEACGVEDPRVAFFNGTYYMFYTAYNCTNAMLAFATATDPTNSTSWTRQGFVLPEKNWSKSGAPLFATSENGLSQHYLFWGDSSSPAGGIGIAVSTDAITWHEIDRLLLATRNDSIDSELVESGPPPIRLASGDFLFVYNSARRGFASVKPDWDLQYNIFYAILDSRDPTLVVQRGTEHIFSPDLDWEVGNSTQYLTPNVVFIEGLVRDPNGCPNNTEQLIGSEFVANVECFFGVYGSADSELGAARILTSWIETSSGNRGYQHNFAIVILALLLRYLTD